MATGRWPRSMAMPGGTAGRVRPDGDGRRGVPADGADGALRASGYVEATEVRVGA